MYSLFFFFFLHFSLIISLLFSISNSFHPVLETQLVYHTISFIRYRYIVILCKNSLEKTGFVRRTENHGKTRRPNKKKFDQPKILAEARQLEREFLYKSFFVTEEKM